MLTPVSCLKVRLATHPSTTQTSTPWLSISQLGALLPALALNVGIVNCKVWNYLASVLKPVPVSVSVNKTRAIGWNVNFLTSIQETPSCVTTLLSHCDMAANNSMWTEVWFKITHCLSRPWTHMCESQDTQFKNHIKKLPTELKESVVKDLIDCNEVAALLSCKPGNRTRNLLGTSLVLFIKF